MRTLQKSGQDYMVMEDGKPIAKLEKDYFGTHGHSCGYLTYVPRNGKWIWTGVIPRVAKEIFEEPPHFGTLKQAKAFFGI